MYKHIIKRSIWRFLRLFAINALTAIGIWYVFCVLIPITANSYIEWIYKAAISGIISMASFALMNITLNFNETKSAVAGMLNKRGPHKI